MFFRTSSSSCRAARRTVYGVRPVYRRLMVRYGRQGSSHAPSGALIKYGEGGDGRRDMRNWARNAKEDM